jgi:lipid II:glycine glycyltransferase (peptidoglycan interpeptide bridge formation enzyme)
MEKEEIYNLNIKEIKPEERELFNNFMANGPKGHILQSYEWGEVKETTGWEPIRLLVEDEGCIKAGISVLKRPLPLPGKSIYYAPRGPVADFSDHKTLDFLLGEIRKRALKDNALFLKIDPDIPAENKGAAVNYLESRGFVSSDKGLNFEGVQPKFVFRLSLDRPIDEIFQNMHSKTRYNIRLAERKGVTVKEDCTKQDLEEFYKILLVTCERDGFMVRSYDYFEAMWEKLVKRGYARLFMAHYRGKAIAGTLAFIFGDKAWYVYGASSNEYRNVMPNYALQWRMIEWAKENGCTIYDFRGVSGDLNPKNPLYGLYRFKKGFGGEFTEFIGEYDLPFSKPLYFLWEKGIPLYREARRKMINLIRKFNK